jgi:acyl-CoA synthetase (AMP-forming)/AMP-acid ligase II
MPDFLQAQGLVAPAVRPPVPGHGPQTLAELLAPALAGRPDAVALVGPSGRLSFRELDEAVGRAAGALLRLGVARGDRVAVSLTNDIDIAIHFLATQRIGAIWVGIQRALTAAEKAELLADCGARLLVADDQTLAAVGALRPRPRAALLPLAHWRERIRETVSPVALAEVDPFAPAVIAYTSGTTGTPKGVVHSQHNVLLAGAMLVHTGARAAAPIGVVLSLTLVNMIARALVPAWYGAQPLVCIDRHDAATIARRVHEEQIGGLDLVPTLAADLLARDDLRAELATLEEIAIGGASCPPEIAAALREQLGVRVALAYGMTEAPTGVALSRGEPAPAPGYCGRAVPQVALEVVDEQGTPLPPGEVGELCVSAAPSGTYAGVYTPMLGYWGRPEATRAALRAGRYHTGDLGSIDAQGRVFVRGRRSELILRGGANVVPAEVERVLEAHPEVRGAAVLGVPDARLGERVVAAVELVPGARADEAGLRAHTAQRLARYKVPDRIAILDALPRNALGKVVKPTLRERLVQETG